MNRVTITIEGPACTGKSAIAAAIQAVLNNYQITSSVHDEDAPVLDYKARLHAVAGNTIVDIRQRTVVKPPVSHSTVQ